jgi:hypothetical protein
VKNDNANNNLKNSAKGHPVKMSFYGQRTDGAGEEATWAGKNNGEQFWQ